MVAAQRPHHAFSTQAVSNLPRATKHVAPTQLYSHGNQPIHSMISHRLCLVSVKPYPYCATRFWDEVTLVTEFVCLYTFLVTDEVYTTYINEEIGQYNISDINVVGVVTAATASSTTQTLAALPSTSSILSTPSSTSVIISAASGTSETLSSLAATTSPTNQSINHISVGAIAGVGVGVLISLLIGMAIILFYHRHTRHRQSLQPNTSRTSVPAQIQALNTWGPVTRGPRTTSKLGWMPRELPISGPIHMQQELPASEILEIQQTRYFKKHRTARSSKSDLGQVPPGAPLSI